MKNTKELYKENLQLQEIVTLISDIWSSCGYDSVISFTPHFITDKFVRRHCLLQASKFNERHTVDNTALMFADCICQWEFNIRLFVFYEMERQILLQTLTVLVRTILLVLHIIYMLFMMVFWHRGMFKIC